MPVGHGQKDCVRQTVLLRLQKLSRRFQRRRRILKPAFELRWTVLLRKPEVEPFQVVGTDQFLEIHLSLFSGRTGAETLRLKANILVRWNHLRPEPVRRPMDTPFLLEPQAIRAEMGYPLDASPAAGAGEASNGYPISARIACGSSRTIRRTPVARVSKTILVRNDAQSSPPRPRLAIREREPRRTNRRPRTFLSHSLHRDPAVRNTDRDA